MSYFILSLATALLISSSFTHTYRNGINENSKSKVVPQQNAQQSSLPVDIQTVTNFMANNGGWVLSYQESQAQFRLAGKAFGMAKNNEQKTEAARLVLKGEANMKRCKANMVDIHKNPKDWTIEDLQKMKTDPKGAEAFNALVRVRDAIYGNEHSAEIK